MAAGREERWICARLRGEAIEDAQPPDAAVLLQVAKRHRVHILLADRLGDDAGSHRFQGLLAPFVRRAQIEEAIFEIEAVRALEACAAAGVQPLIVKGAALAYSIYPRPWQRPRDDLDLFVAEPEARVLRQVFVSLGYETPPQIESNLVTRQFQVIRRLAGGLRFTVDVHWRLFNLRPFEDVLSHGEATSRAVAIPRLGGNARTLDAGEALFVACLHRVVHHDDADDLIWLYDLHLLAQSLDGTQWQRLVERARRSRTCGVLRASLTAAGECFGTPLSDDRSRELAAAEPEPSAAFLGGGMRQIDIELMNLRHERGSMRRVGLVLQHLFPPPAYMIRRYEVPHVTLLPFFYAIRIFSGAPRWWRRYRG